MCNEFFFVRTYLCMKFLFSDMYILHIYEREGIMCCISEEDRSFFCRVESGVVLFNE